MPAETNPADAIAAAQRAIDKLSCPSVEQTALTAVRGLNQPCPFPLATVLGPCGAEADSAEFEMKIWGRRPADPAGSLGGQEPITDKDQEAGQSRRSQLIEKEQRHLFNRMLPQPPQTDVRECATKGKDLSCHQFVLLPSNFDVL